jgi:peptidoglycan/xylan/chitin deacetylase (PgdA/CDA1 family)
MPPKLLVVIDTEEDWYDDVRAKPTVANIAALPLIQQRFFDPLGVRPVYLINYPVATDPDCVAVFREFVQAGVCEIGTHVHNWTSPPFSDDDVRLRTYHTDLHYEGEKHKISEITRIVQDGVGVRPRTFKGGRWGVTGQTLRILRELGYSTDTSVCPVTDFTPEGGPDFFDAPFDPYFPSLDDVTKPRKPRDPGGDILELPVSIGFARQNFEQQRRWLATVRRHSALRRLHVVGLLHRTALIQRIKLSPETSTFQEMKSLIDAIMLRGHELLHMTFHSCILHADTSPYSRTQQDLDNRLRSLADTLSYIMEDLRVSCVTAREYTQSRTGEA